MATNFNFDEPNYVVSNDFNFGFSIVTYRLLAGSSTNYTAIWADSDASLRTASVYIASAGTGAAFSVVDLSSKLLLDSYKIDSAGNRGDLLDDEDIVDINVNNSGG
jgi:hypothetical protein